MNSTLKTKQLKQHEKGDAESIDASDEAMKKSSVDACIQKSLDLEEGHPLLQEPSIYTEKVVCPLNPIEWNVSSFEKIATMDYDASFNEQLPLCAKVMVKKGKFTEEQWTEPAFLNAIYYEYAHPQDKRGNKKAKRLGNKMTRYSLENLTVSDQEKKQLIEKHREQIKTFIKEVSDPAFEARIFREVRELPDDAQAPVLAATYRADMRSYFPEAIQQQYYAIEKDVTNNQREFYGTATDHQFSLNGDCFELSMLYEHKNVFIKNLYQLDLPEELKAQVLGRYFRSEMQDDPSKVVTSYHQLIDETEEEVYTRYFSSSYRLFLTNVLRDHLYFRDHYLKAAKEYTPPLTVEELGGLDDHIRGKSRSLEEGLKVIHDNCYLEAYESLLANDIDLCIRWKTNPHTMEKACQLLETIHRFLNDEKCDEESTDEVIYCLTNRQLTEQSATYHVAQKQLDCLLEKAWKEIEETRDTRLQKIRALNDNISFISEFRRLYQPVNSAQLSQWFKKKKSMPRNAQQVMRIVLKKVKQERGLPSNWKPNIGLIVKATDSFDKMVEANLMAFDYVREVMLVMKELSLNSSSVELEIFCQHAKEAMATAVGNRMFSNDKILAYATSFEETSMQEVIGRLQENGTSRGLIFAMQHCFPLRYAGWVNSTLSLGDSEEIDSIKQFIKTASPKGLNDDVLETVCAITLSAAAGFSLNVGLEQCLSYVSRSIDDLFIDAEVNQSTQKICNLLASYLVAASAVMQNMTRLLVKTGTLISNSHVESVTIDHDLRKKSQQEEPVNQEASSVENKEDNILYQLVMTTINHHRESIIDGVSTIYQIPKSTLSQVWNHMTTHGDFSFSELVKSTGSQKNHFDHLKRVTTQIINDGWEVINKQQQFDNIGCTLSQMIQTELLANVENYDIKFFESMKITIESSEQSILRLSSDAIAETSINLAITREQFFPNESLFDELDKKILKKADHT
jgi:hypothetical protein